MGNTGESLSRRNRRREERQRMTAKVTRADVRARRRAGASGTRADEVEPMLRDLNAILDYVAELNQLDTSGIEPLAQVGELENAVIPRPRLDRIEPSLIAPSSWHEAPETDGVFFKVPKVIER